ncbi:hypothetical protein [Microbispora sp. KK1-11]|uniref:hypothetical protein n=1 Tax=Microbispora sp. KK1-11 TaxID=2053005 RepID=UPI001157A14A|nr:hypothetical protein [Microbispora sp. KK1-11]TQS22289.1 hypothetical protein FLW16_38385 [Microbispora sp. KK1-11]
MWDVPTGRIAAAIERRVLDWWRTALGAAPALTNACMPQNGATETASLALVDPDATAALVISLTREDQ